MKSIILSISILLQTTFLYAQDKNKTVYYFAVGWEYLPQDRDAETNAQPVVSNVTRINCDGYIFNSSLGVDNQLAEYYKAYHAKQRGFGGMNRTIAFGPYDTWEEAESDRRKNIADYNRKWKPFVLQHFRYLCKED